MLGFCGFYLTHSKRVEKGAFLNGQRGFQTVLKVRDFRTTQATPEKMARTVGGET